LLAAVSRSLGASLEYIAFLANSGGICEQGIGQVDGLESIANRRIGKR
jgi:hypothetical protein